MDARQLRKSFGATESSTPSLLSRPSLPAPSNRILDFDIETRRIGFHSGFKGSPDGCEPITIAVSWVGEKEVKSVLISQSQDIPHMLEWFLEFYTEADVVTGHYIRKFDLPILNGALMEWGMDLLEPKLTIDTKVDHKSVAGIGLSQENLGIYHRLTKQKYHMADADWRRATRLTHGGQRKSRLRAEHDVKQHKELRKAMHKRGVLRPMQVWKP